MQQRKRSSKHVQLTSFLPQRLRSLLDQSENPALAGAARRFSDGLIRIAVNATTHFRHQKIKTNIHNNLAVSIAYLNTDLKPKVLAISKNQIYEHCGRTGFEKMLREAFYLEIHHGSNLDSWGCSAFTFHPDVAKALQRFMEANADNGSLDKYVLGFRQAMKLGENYDFHHDITFSGGDLSRFKRLKSLAARAGKIDEYGFYSSLINELRPTGNNTFLLRQYYRKTSTSRFHGVGPLSLQATRSDLRSQVLKSWVDYDVSAACYSMVYNRAIEEGIDLPAFKYYIKNKDQCRQDIANIRPDHHGLTPKQLLAASPSIDDAKIIMTSIQFGPITTEEMIAADNGGKTRLSLSKLFKGNGNALKAYRNIPWFRELIVETNNLKRHYAKKVVDGKLTNEAGATIDVPRRRAGKILSHIYFGIETNIMSRLYEWMSRRGIEYIPIHDGFVSKHKFSQTELREITQEDLSFSIKRL